MRIQLVEFNERIVDGPPTTEPNTVLRNIYNTIPGPAFRYSAFSTVWYHCYSPALNDEVKIRLPEVVTDKHWLRITVYHIHVKVKESKFPSMLQSHRKGAIGEDASCLILGRGYLQLLTDNLCLLPDREHTVEIYGENLNDDSTVDEDSPTPSITNWGSKKRASTDISPCSVKIRTRAYSSLISTNKAIQTLLVSQPSPLGYLPSSNMPIVYRNEPVRLGPPYDDLKIQREESNLAEAAAALQQASAIEVTKHFLVIMRILIRVLCGGTCRYKAEYSNPYAHPMPRCRTFLSMLLVFGKVSPDVHHSGYREDRATGEDLLNAYVEYLFDEEVPNYGTASRRGTEDNLEIDPETKESDYFSEVVEHLVLESLRVVIHSEIHDAVATVAKEMKAGEEFPTPGTVLFNLTQRHLRWWSLIGNTPFNSEKAWFESSDGNPWCSIGVSALRSDDYHTTPSKDELTLSPVIRRFDKLEGYAERKLRVGLGKKGSIETQWWPWLYEVIVCQWNSLLLQLQDNELGEVDNEEYSGEDVDESRSDASFVDEPTSYPFAKESIPASTESTEDIRTLALDHGPILLKMILKSLAMRLKREGHTCPVILDDQFMSALERLVMTLSSEIVSLVKGPWRSRKVNVALAQFLRSLFILVAPIQVSKLIYYYCATLRKKTKAIEIELRLQFIEELSLYDKLVSVNFPFTLDETGSHFKPGSLRSSIESHFRLGGSGMAGVRNPPNNWIAHLFCDEIMVAYRHEERVVKERAMAAIRDLFCRHSYDMRYQDEESRRRIASMYLPLIQEIVCETDSLIASTCDLTERKEVLSVLLYLLQDVPERLLREEWRSMTKMQVTSRLLTPCNSSSGRLTSNEGVPARPPSMSMHVQPPIIRFLKLLHVMLDSFEFPLSPGGDQGDPSIILVPWLQLAGGDMDEKAPATKPSTLRGAGQVKGASDALSKLDHLRQSNTRTSMLKRGKVRGRGEERKWKSHAIKHATDTMKNQTYMASVSNITPNTMIKAAQNVSHESSNIVLYTLTIILEECPPKLITVNDYSSFTNTRSPYGDFMILAVSLILHGLMTYISEEAIVRYFAGAQLYIRRFGYRSFIAAAGDTLQDWLRTTLSYCSSQHIRPRTAACDFFLYLYQSCFHYTGTINHVLRVSLAIFDDVILSALGDVKRKTKSKSDSIKYLLPLQLSLRQMKNTLDIATLTTSKYKQFKLCMKSVFSSLELLLTAECELHEYFSEFVDDVPNWDGTKTLDCTLTSENSRGRVRESPKSPSSAGSHLSAATNLNFDLEAVMEHFAKASELFDANEFPRIRIMWLERLAKLQDRYGNKSESAEIRWQIYKVCDSVKTVWETLWAPRPKMFWSRASRSEGRESQIQFLDELYSLLEKPPSKPWPDLSCLLQHMQSALTVAADTFASVGLIHLAERCCCHYLGLCRANGTIGLMTPEYGKMFKTLENLSDAKLRFAMGSFYRVQYSGQGMKIQNNFL